MATPQPGVRSRCGCWCPKPSRRCSLPSGNPASLRSGALPTFPPQRIARHARRRELYRHGGPWSRDPGATTGACASSSGSGTAQYLQPPSSRGGCGGKQAGGRDPSARSIDESLQGSHVLVDSFEEALEDSAFMDKVSDVHSEHEGESQGAKFVLRSLWDMKLPELSEHAQFQKMVQVLVLTAAAAVLSNMDKVNIAVAAVPMMAELGWSKTVVGVLQASFFWGYLLAQIPSGKLVSQFNGRLVLAVGVLLWSLGTLMVPACAYTNIAWLCFARFLVGFFQATAPSANADLITRWAAIEERSRAVTAVWAGFNLGNVIGLLAAPACVSIWGWESVFYIFGSLGIVWSLGWLAVNHGLQLPSKVACSRNQFVRVREYDKEQPREVLERPKKNTDPIPYGTFFKLPAFWAMNTVHFCENWGKFTLMAWMPAFYRSNFDLSLTTSSALSILPYVLGIVVSSVGATAADALVKRGWELTTVRKLMQGIASGGAGTCLLLTLAASSPVAVVASLTAALAVSSLSTVGLYCSHQDISPKYAGVLLSVTNTFGSLPGMLGNLLVGFLMDATGSWAYSLMIPCIVCYAISLITWLALYSSEPVDFDNYQPSRPRASGWKKIGGLATS
mmetsp:Transcript_30910/g.87495  ORF Transcript_30910/g.87495 Transcript_30910/m.87495 type:complete len:619 (-) Transcript_30910:88-1944(-)